MKTLLSFVIFSVFCFLNLSLTAQEYRFSSTNKRALKQYKIGEEAYKLLDFQIARGALNKAVKADNKFIEAWLLLGDVNTEIGHNDNAIEAYEKAIQIDPRFFPGTYFFTGNLYFQNGDYSKAISNYESYLDLSSKNAPNRAQVISALRQAHFAENAVNHPVPSVVVNAGAEINSLHDDYINYVSPKRDYLVLTRKEAIHIDEHGRVMYSEKFYQASFLNNIWLQPDTIAIDWDEGLNLGGMNLSVDGRKMYFTGCNWLNGFGSCDLYVSEKYGDKWKPPFNLGTRINSQWWESQAHISSDGGQLLFASRRAGGKGGTDIWMSIRLTDGKWSPPVNLGDSINTNGNEMSPFLHPDGKTLYFSSDGHHGLGGADLFISRQDETGRWSKAENLGYPINTNQNEINLFAGLNGEVAWITSDRAGGFGRADIYNFELHEKIKPDKVSFIRGVVVDEYNGKPLGARIELTNLKTGMVVDSSWSDPVSGEFLMVLKHNIDYAFNISKRGYLFYSENYNVSDSIVFQSVDKTFELVPVESGQQFILKNIFFDFNSTELRAASNGELNRLTEILTENPGIRIQIAGYTDNIGNDEYNLNLSIGRAEAVYKFLVDQGINAERLKFTGFGATRPIDSNDSEESRAKNRRTEITIL